MVSAKSVVLSMLYNKKWTVPTVESAVQLEQKVKRKVANQFTAFVLCSKEMRTDKEKRFDFMGAKNFNC